MYPSELSYDKNRYGLPHIQDIRLLNLLEFSTREIVVTYIDVVTCVKIYDCKYCLLDVCLIQFEMFYPSLYLINKWLDIF